jgi:hypothetical protein
MYFINTHVHCHNSKLYYTEQSHIHKSFNEGLVGKLLKNIIYPKQYMQRL